MAIAGASVTETEAAGVAWMTLPAAVATALVVPSGLAATLTVPAAVGSGAAVAGLEAATRKSPAATDRPRPNANFFNSDSLLWRPTVPGALLRLSV